MLASSRNQEQLVLLFYFFLCLVVKRKAAQAARVHQFRAQQRVSPYSNQSNLLFVQPRCTTTPFHCHACQSSNTLITFGAYAYTWAKSRKLVRNCISVYISVESLWNRFQTTSRGGLETALESALESVLTCLHTRQSEQV